MGTPDCCCERACRSCQLAARAARALGKRALARRPRVVLPPAARTREITSACVDCGDLTWLSGGLCGACRGFRRVHPAGTCPWCGRQQPISAAGACRSCQCAARAIRQRARDAPRARPVPSPAVPPPLGALAGYGQGRGWVPHTLR